MSRDRLKHAGRLALGLALLAGMGYGLYVFARWSIELFSQINPTVGAGMLAATSALIVSVLSLLIAKHLEQKASIAKEQRDKKAPTYEELLEFLFLLIHGEKLSRGALTEQEQLERMSRFNQKVIVWGSDDVIAQFAEFRQMSFAGVKPILIAVALEKLLLAIRRDLGHKNKGLGPGSLLRTFLNDLHKL
jgi:hypothetical protein